MSQVERQRFGHECIYYGNQAGVYFEVVGERSQTTVRSTFLEVVDFSRGDFESKKRYRFNSYDLRKLARMLDEAADEMDGIEDTSEKSVSSKEDDLSCWDRW